MNIPQIKMDSTMAQLGLRIEKPMQHIEQPKADLHIEQPAAELSIRTSRGKLTIDQSKAWEDMKLYSPLKSTKVYTGKSRGKWFEGLAKMSQEGDMMMNVHQNKNAVATIAKGKKWSKTHGFNVGWIPSVFSVKTQYQPSNVNIDIKRNEPVIQSKINKPIHEYTPGKVSGFMKQWPELKMWVEDQ